MELGAFSVSLSVENMAASRSFYESLGFSMIAGDGATWTISANGSTVIGLFHGMFEGNILTFNPGWEGVGTNVDVFTDVRQLSAGLVEGGVATNDDTTGDTPSGPASFSVTDPDGNVILFDQHV
jgi:catechol 2,3-dioxygenase-like lactoylglutathione lyase family enzyme